MSANDMPLAARAFKQAQIVDPEFGVSWFAMAVMQGDEFDLFEMAKDLSDGVVVTRRSCFSTLCNLTQLTFLCLA